MSAVVPRFRIHRPQLLTVLIALLVAAIALAPLAEAAACTPEYSEPGIAAGASLVAGDEASSETDDCCTPSQGCVYGYCHAPSSLPPAPAEVWRAIERTTRMTAPPALILRSTAPDGLTRPPRA